MRRVPLYTATSVMPRFVLSLAVVLGLVLAATACGGDDEDSTAVGAAKAHEAAIELEGDSAQGRKVWTIAGCGACHTLSSSDATGTSGPNLDEVLKGQDVVDKIAKIQVGGQRGDTPSEAVWIEKAAVSIT